MISKVFLKIGSLNIQGSAKIKCETADIRNLIAKHHIFIIEESWLEKKDACPVMPSYTSFRSERKKHPRAKRNSGGIVMYISHSIAKGVTKMTSRANKCGDAIWIKLDKTYFGLSSDVYLCGGYIVPNADDDAFEVLRREIESFSSLGHVCLIGDYNSRMSISQPQHYTLQLDSDTDMVDPLPIPPRRSMDLASNSNGNKMLDLLTNYDLFIANGFVMGDLEGNHTCCTWNGVSVNDVFLFHRDLYRHINYFKVDDHFQWYSDHRTITVSLNVNIRTSNSGGDSWNKLLKRKMNWDSEMIEKYKDILQQPDTVEKLRNFAESDFPDSDSVAANFTSILDDILAKVFPKKSKKRAKYSSKQHEYSHVCQIAKRIFRQAQRRFSREKTNADRRHKFIVERRNYRRAIYAAKKLSKEKKINDLLNLEKLDVKAFWKGLKSIISPKDDSIDNIDKGQWVNHFSNVLNVPAARGNDTQFLEYVKSSLPHLENNIAVNNLLNYNITHEEILSSIKELKMGKSVFTDDIGNEALRHGYVYLKDCFHHLFNVVFQSGCFPSQWTNGLIIPLHKKGDKMDANNYRGIIISSCVSKLMLKILTKRIDGYMSRTGKWSIHQCGFKKDHRTEDNLFILDTIHDKYVKEMKKDVYLAFIDFSKFFDKINRDMMLYKLLKYDVNGSIYDIIKSVYKQTGYQVKMGDSVSPLFYGQNGLKQGCCMSPTLSSIYQNDLHDIFNTNDCEPLQLGSITLNSVSWADDLILMSLSNQGLQNCLHKLVDYCRKWGLEINEKKTKCMVMSKKRGPFAPLYIYGTPIEYVKSIHYLGFHINRNGNIDSVTQDRILKASRVSHMVLQALRTNRNVSSKLAISLFDKQILPILLYGCSVWGLPRTQNLIYLEQQDENQNTREIVTHVFSSIMNRSVPIEYARRVGKRSTDGLNTRKILVKLKSYSDKKELLRLAINHNRPISNFIEKEYDIEKVHNDFCKKSLNVSKYASNVAVQGELGRFPISNTAKSVVIKYWLRLNAGTKNVLLNEAYNMCVNSNLGWIQGVQYLLCENGFGNIWQNPNTVNKDCFHKYFKQRLNDQHIQNWNSRIMNSNRFKILQTLHKEYKMSNYIERIRNPTVREIYTRLRIDMNILSTSKIHGNHANTTCFLCQNEEETVGHFLFRCPRYYTIRTEIYNKIANVDVHFQNLNDEDKLRYILDTQCPAENLGVCCKFLLEMYTKRETENVSHVS